MTSIRSACNAAPRANCVNEEVIAERYTGKPLLFLLLLLLLEARTVAKRLFQDWRLDISSREREENRERNFLVAFAHFKSTFSLKNRIAVYSALYRPTSALCIAYSSRDNVIAFAGLGIHHLPIARRLLHLSDYTFYSHSICVYGLY